MINSRPLWPESFEEAKSLNPSIKVPLRMSWAPLDDWCLPCMPLTSVEAFLLRCSFTDALELMEVRALPTLDVTIEYADLRSPDPDCRGSKES